MPKIIEGQLSAAGFRFAVVASRFNNFVGDKLLSGALDALARHGCDKDKLNVVYVPGSFEIPLICKKLAQSSKIDAIIAIGAVIRGATPHFDLVSGELAKGIAQVSLETSVPITLGVLTTDSIEQAIERSGSKAGNKGAEAAMAAIEMVNVLHEIGKEKL